MSQQHVQQHFFGAWKHWARNASICFGFLACLGLMGCQPTAQHPNTPQLQSTHSSAPLIPPIPAGFEGSAYLKLEQRVQYDQSQVGPQAENTQQLLELCNRMRLIHYRLPIQQPDLALAKQGDQAIQELYFDQGQALQIEQRFKAELSDYFRWERERLALANQQLPSKAPNCAVLQVQRYTTGTLWKHGEVYRLDFNRKTAIKQAIGQQFETHELMSITEFNALPQQQVLNATCRQTKTEKMDEDEISSCIWDQFPAQKYLNFPWPLAFEYIVEKQSRRPIRITGKALALERNTWIKPELFTIPTGFVIQKQASSTSLSKQAVWRL